jgi:hypothetical protein
METPHDTESDHVRVDHVLLHHLPFCLSLLLLNLELVILSDSLNDSKRDFGVLLYVVLPEILESVIDVFDLIIGFVFRIRKLFTDRFFMILIRGIIAVFTIQCEDVIQLFLLTRLLDALALEHYLT